MIHNAGLDCARQAVMGWGFGEWEVCQTVQPKGLGSLDGQWMKLCSSTGSARAGEERLRAEWVWEKSDRMGPLLMLEGGKRATRRLRIERDERRGGMEEWKE